MSLRVLVVANDHVGSRMAGPGIRSWRFADELARRFDVTLVVPYETDLASDDFAIRVENPSATREMIALARGFDVVVAQRLTVPAMRTLAGAGVRIIYDLYAPVAIENLAFDTLEERSRPRELHYRLNALEQTVALATGSAFVCASEKQRDLWLGALLASGRIDHETYGRDPSLRNLIDVVPFGLDPQPPVRSRPALRGVVPGIGEDDRILLWGGGIWNWFDPLTVIRAVDHVRRDRDNVRLYFLGTQHPNPQIAEMKMTGRAVALADELGLRDRHVFFNFGWVPYEQLGAYLLEADLGVAAHFDDLETRFAFRTRLVDCIWAGLPIVTTRGDALSELVEARGLGRSVDAGDVDGYAAALEELLAERELREKLAPAFEEMRAELAWPRAVEPLARLVAGRDEVAAAATGGALARWTLTRLEYAVRNRGPAGAARRALRLALPRGRPPLG